MFEQTQLAEFVVRSGFVELSLDDAVDEILLFIVVVTSAKDLAQSRNVESRVGFGQFFSIDDGDMNRARRFAAVGVVECKVWRVRPGRKFC